MDFTDKLKQAKNASGGILCVGLDPDPAKLPAELPDSPHGIFKFSKDVIESTLPFTAAYKLNLAFFEAIGSEGWNILAEVRRAIPADRFVIADGKRGDIGNSARFYAEALFDKLDFDAATVNPYMGVDSVAPFISRRDKGVFILTLTSNKGAEDFQFLGGEKPLFETVALKAAEWNKLSNIGLVAGATQAEHLARLRTAAPGLPFLIPGIGAQGGNLEATVNNALKGFPGGGIINSSRGIIYSSSGSDFASAAGEAAMRLRDAINRAMD